MGSNEVGHSSIHDELTTEQELSGFLVSCVVDGEGAVGGPASGSVVSGSHPHTRARIKRDVQPSQSNYFLMVYGVI